MAALVPALAKAQPGDGPITIGVHYPLTGPSSELGLGFQYGARLALSEINAHDGVNGRELKLILVDDKSTPDGAITAVQRLTAGSTVALLWGGSSSSPTIAMLPRLKAGPTPYYAGFASGPRVLEPFGRYVFSGASAPVPAVVAGVAGFVAHKLQGTYAMWVGGSQFIGDPSGPMADWQARFAKAYSGAPAGFPNQYSLRAYADAYVIAEALRRCGKDVTSENIVTQLDTISNFVAGKDETFTDAAAVGLPRSFSPTQHQGTNILAPVVVRDGRFQAVP